MDKQKGVAKTVRFIEEAGGQGTNIIVFPEAFIPAYPRGMSFGAVIGSRSDEGRKDFLTYWKNAITVPGTETVQIGEAVKNANAYVVIGVIERDQETSGGTLYCTALFFGPDGLLIGKHRKLKPTGSERLIWGEGDGSTLSVFDTPYGRLGALICLENYMPLARAALYEKGVQIYVMPTADARDTWSATVRHVAAEGRCFVLSYNQYSTKACIRKPFLPMRNSLHCQKRYAAAAAASPDRSGTGWQNRYTGKKRLFTRSWIWIELQKANSF